VCGETYHLDAHDALVDTTSVVVLLGASTSGAAQAHEGRAERGDSSGANHVDGVVDLSGEKKTRGNEE
jgi:hypothetical protein